MEEELSQIISEQKNESFSEKVGETFSDKAIMTFKQSKQVDSITNLVHPAIPYSIP
jgi:hypothetical protein